MYPKLKTTLHLTKEFLKSSFTRRHDNKIIIAGTGRAGTSFLMVLLTRLRYDTGLQPYNEDYSRKIRAGGELRLFTKDKQQQKRNFQKAPRILKHPEYSYRLREYLEDDLIGVDHLIIPVRDIKDAAKSRLKTGLYWQIPGVSKKAKTQKNQEETLRYADNELRKTIKDFHLSATFIDFPKLVKDADYLYKKLKPIFPDLNKKDFLRVYNDLAKPEIIETK